MAFPPELASDPCLARSRSDLSPRAALDETVHMPGEILYSHSVVDRRSLDFKSETIESEGSLKYHMCVTGT